MTEKQTAIIGNYQSTYVQIQNELDGKFTTKKMDNTPLIESYRRLGFESAANKVTFCGSDLEYRVPADFSAPAKLYHANFCKDRLCGCCAWRRSMKTFGQISKILDELQDYAFIFLTLTIRNTSAELLPDAVNELQEGFARLMKIKPIKAAIKGVFKALEITHNRHNARSIEYHPHLHCIAAVNKSYFTSRNYISQEELIKYWQNACRLDYEPSVRIQKIKPLKTAKNEIKQKSAICEVAKYSVKTYEYLSGSPEEIDRTVATYTTALSGRRLCSYTGVFKEAAKKLKLDDMTDGDLVNTENENQKVRSDIAYLIISFKWQVGIGYQHQFTREEVKDDSDPTCA